MKNMNWIYPEIPGESKRMQGCGSGRTANARAGITHSK